MKESGGTPTAEGVPREAAGESAEKLLGGCDGKRGTAGRGMLAEKATPLSEKGGERSPIFGLRSLGGRAVQV